MNAFIKFLQNIPDKVAHILICMLGSIVFGFSFGLGASLAAEYKDLVHGGRWDWLDFVAGMFGTILGSLVNFLIIREIWLA